MDYGNHGGMTGKIGLVFLYCIIGAALILVFFPIYWMIISSLKPQGTIFSFPPILYPKGLTAHRYYGVLVAGGLWRNFLSSTICVLGYVSLNVFFCSMAGFAFAKYDFWAKNVVFMLVLATLMIPFQVTLIPLFFLMSKIGWIDTYQGVFVPFAINAFGIFLMRQIMSSIPTELLHAARIDGYSEFKIYLKIALPLSKPGLITLTMLSTIYSWNDFLWPLIILNSNDRMTIPVYIANLQGLYLTDYGAIMASGIIATAPIVVVFILIQKYFVAGALKGAFR